MSHGLSAALARAVGLLAIALAAWSLVDEVRCARSGDVRKATLGLPAGIKQRIHKVIRVGLSTHGLLLGSLGVGVAVALLEGICTGQVYLPVLTYVSRSPALRARALAYLLLYNLMFILPLAGVFLLAYWGVGSERLGGWLRRHLAAMCQRAGKVYQ